MFDWDRSNLRKIRAHRMPVVTERGSNIRVVTAYDLVPDRNATISPAAYTENKP